MTAQLESATSREPSIFTQYVTAKDFKDSMRFGNDDFNLSDVLKDYPDAEGTIDFDDVVVS